MASARRAISWALVSVLVAPFAAAANEVDCAAAQRKIQRLYAAWRGAEEFEKADGLALRIYRRHERDAVALSATPEEDVRLEDVANERRRIEAQTKDPVRLEQLYAALDHDEATIDQCLVRPLLVERALNGKQDSRGVANENHGPGVPDSWSPLSLAAAPEARAEHTAVWTGSHMIVWGGLSASDSPLDSGGLYDPVLDAWSPTSLVNAPAPRHAHAAVWTGTRMFVWGGMSGASRWDDTTRLGDGRLYDPLTNQWTVVEVNGAPEARSYPTAVWTGTDVIIWGGHAESGLPPPDHHACGPMSASGARYDPSTNAWTAIPDAPGGGRAGSGGAWTGSRMFVHGGYITSEFVPFGFNCDAGFSVPAFAKLYDPVAAQWTGTTADPLSMAQHTIVWTGSLAIPWGGFTGPFVPQGYAPATDDWTALSTTGMPPGGEPVWASQSMISWGGQRLNSYSDEGGIYVPECDAWFATATTAAPQARRAHTVSWTGARLLVWGGRTVAGKTDTGGAYLPPLLDDDLDGALNCADNCPLAANPDQSDLDSDSVGDLCDVCPLDPDDDIDADGRCADDDNCPLDPNAGQEDVDSDGRGDICDNCPLVHNPAQADLDGDNAGNLCDLCPETSDFGQADGDGDGVGDACDCEPADPNDAPPQRVSLLSPARIGGTTVEFSWLPVTGADTYSVSRGLVTATAVSSHGSCLLEGIEGTSFQDASPPPPAGDAYAYLVQGQSFECGLGTLGFGAAERVRSNLDPGACSGVVALDSTPGGETSVFGTVTGSFVDTVASDGISERITEEETGGNPSSRTSRLEHRWTFQLPTSNRVELHVEGHRSVSPDGDDFVFEVSTDGGSNWSPAGLPALPSAEDAIDLVTALPSTLSGTVIMRVVDTDRTAGNRDLDSIWIDRLFVRSIP